MPKTLSFETNVGTGAAVTDGQVASTASLGSTALTPAAANHTYAADAKYEGNFGTKVSTTSAAATVQRYALADATLRQFSGCAVFSLDAVPSATFTSLWTVRYSSGVALRVIQNSAGVFGVRGQQTTTPQQVGTVARAAAHQYLVTVLMTVDPTTATAGKYQVKFYDAATKALLDSFTQAGLALDLTTNALAASDIGFCNSDPQVGRSLRYDSVKLVEGGTTEVFPDSWNTASHLAGNIYDGSANVPGNWQHWDGSALTDFSSLSIA